MPRDTVGVSDRDRNLINRVARATGKRQSEVITWMIEQSISADVLAKFDAFQETESQFVELLQTYFDENQKGTGE